METLSRKSCLAPTNVLKGGKTPGTYVSKALVYAYAMWISEDFHLQVIEAYDALVTKQAELMEASAARSKARLEAPFMTDAVQFQRSSQGKECKQYHFSNEFDLINRIVLGTTAKQYRVEHGIAANDAIRDFLTPCEIMAVEHLQRLNASMIDLGMDYETRKAKLNQQYLLRHSRHLLSEVARLEA